jgi:hypothetical protein
MKPGPKPRPERVLRDAAITFAVAVELEDVSRADWDRLRKAALRYAASAKVRGRPSTPEPAP